MTERGKEIEIKRAFELVNELLILAENSENNQFEEIYDEVQNVYEKIDELWVEVLKKRG